jgi:hypothetical protein
VNVTYKVIRNPAGLPQVVLADEPKYCHALGAAPQARESMLNRGDWLAMTFAEWSAPDIEAVQTALEVAKHYAGEINLGVRPYRDPLEQTTWCVEIDPDLPGPTWVLLKEGKALVIGNGTKSVDELIFAIGAHR